MTCVSIYIEKPCVSTYIESLALITATVSKWTRKVGDFPGSHICWLISFARIIYVEKLTFNQKLVFTVKKLVTIYTKGVFSLFYAS